MKTTGPRPIEWSCLGGEVSWLAPRGACANTLLAHLSKPQPSELRRTWHRSKAFSHRGCPGIIGPIPQPVSMRCLMDSRGGQAESSELPGRPAFKRLQSRARGARAPPSRRDGGEDTLGERRPHDSRCLHPEPRVAAGQVEAPPRAKELLRRAVPRAPTGT